MPPSADDRQPGAAAATSGPPHVLPWPSGPTRAQPLLRDILDDVARDRAARGLPALHLALDAPADCLLDVDATALGPVLAGLVRAACRAAAAARPTADAPPLHEVIVTVVEAATGVECEIADSGTGTPTVDPAALAAARGFVRQHGGDLRVEACPEGGTAVTLWLPRRTVRRRAA